MLSGKYGHWIDVDTAAVSRFSSSRTVTIRKTALFVPFVVGFESSENLTMRAEQQQGQVSELQKMKTAHVRDGVDRREHLRHEQPEIVLPEYA